MRRRRGHVAQQTTAVFVSLFVVAVAGSELIGWLTMKFSSRLILVNNSSDSLEAKMLDNYLPNSAHICLSPHSQL